jgi:hypothetical protein
VVVDEIALAVRPKSGISFGRELALVMGWVVVTILVVVVAVGETGG